MTSEKEFLKDRICHDCGCREGEIHRLDCDMEECPFCGGRLIACGCAYALLGVDVSPGTWAYKNGLTDTQEVLWSNMLAGKGRIPYVVAPVYCRRCLEPYPQMWMTSTKEWKRVVPKSMQRFVLCMECYNQIGGWVGER